MKFSTGIFTIAKENDFPFGNRDSGPEAGEESPDHVTQVALDVGRLKAVGLDETTSKRGHNYVTVFIDLDTKQKPVIFVTPGKGKACLVRFKAFLAEHGGKTGCIAEVVCDMSPAFLAAIGETFESATVTIDWFHVVQLFTRAVDEVRKAETVTKAGPNGEKLTGPNAGDSP